MVFFLLFGDKLLLNSIFFLTTAFLRNNNSDLYQKNRYVSTLADLLQTEIPVQKLKTVKKMLEGLKKSAKPSKTPLALRGSNESGGPGGR